MPIPLSSPSPSPTGNSFVASGTTYNLYRFEQDFGMAYEIVNYKTVDSLQWPPSDTCTQVSGIKVTWGKAWTNTSKITYNSSSVPGSYIQQTYTFSSNTSSSGLGDSGVIYSNNPGLHVRLWNASSDDGLTLGYLSEDWALSTPVIIPVGDSRIFSGDDGGQLATQFVATVLTSIQSGGLQNHLASWTVGVPNWRLDLII